ANNVFSVKIRNGNLYLCGDYGYMGQIANTPAAPTQPGYIYGPTSVCTDNTEVYKLPTPYDGSYTWNVSGVSSEVKLMTNAVQIGFLDKGEVTITVTAANQCGESQPRTLTIVASEPTPPIISGAETVDENRKAETYEVTNGTEQASLWWSVEGGTIASTGNKTVKVDWDNEGDGAVKLQISDPVSGCLAQSQLTVSIVKPVGLEETNAIRVFPNPSRDIFNVTGTNCISGYEILSVEGKVVRRKLIDQAEATLSIDMTGEKPGMYLLKLFGCNTSSVTKVVKY
ncbi:MAG: T9SS type A sorting domain-containing protein, partial [Bacteroidota bacterium]